MCQFCLTRRPASLAPFSSHRRAWLTLGAAALATPALAQVDVGNASRLRSLVPAEDLEQAAQQQYSEVIAKAKAEGQLAPAGDAQLQRLRRIAQRLVAQAGPWNERAGQWQWEINLIRADDINAWCMPGGKIAVYTGLLTKLQLSDDEVAMIVGHEMAHALREHAREQLAKQTATGAGLSIVSSLFGLGDLGNTLANLGGQLLVLKFSRNDETEADLVGLEIAARAGYNPRASISLWNKMMANDGGQGGFLSTHPSGPNRIRQLEANLGKVQGLYEKSRVAQTRLPQRAVGTHQSTTAPAAGPSTSPSAPPARSGEQPGAFQTPVGRPL
ncbi:peptidase M48 [Comamonas serinivorans]|uniref:Peptidase M48 n=1 Tax=Comamonas serinivorans TaxID=1082851 RepID=A0A1Y0EST1_9BURK|nr:peptidase M48 [Comamonas serinivorans]